MRAKIGAAVLAALVVLLVVIATRPDTFRISRRATIAAPAEVVFTQLDDFRLWGNWSPWEKVDPDMQRTYAGAPSGVGATYHWVGNSKVGEGRLTLTESTPSERVVLRAEFIKPFAATNAIEFTLTPAPAGVEVTWAMSGRQPFLGKAFSLVMNMDRMVGRDFEKGLAELKRVSETQAQQQPQGASHAS